MPKTLLQAAALISAPLSQAGGVIADEELIRLCSEGLKEIAGDFQETGALAKASANFFQELLQAGKRLCKENSAPHCVQDEAFMLFESMALVLREISLRKGLDSLGPAGRKILQHFEQSDQWRLGQGTVVADMYYTRIPLALMQEITTH